MRSQCDEVPLPSLTTPNAQPIASLAVLADQGAGWKPDGFDLEQLGCTHRFRFPVVKLLDYADRLAALEAGANPFALINAAHLLHDADAP